MQDESQSEGAFEFTGNWREFAPIAFTNLLLTIVTLGIYTFWARTRVRTYLWSHTRFIDDRLEWTGTGLELFIGYVLAFVLFIIPLGILQFVLQGIVLRGHPGAAAVIFLVAYLFLIYLAGVAIFRALRYRLSRTFWHGIRGGSDNQGLGYGLSYLWRTLVGTLVLGLLIPWSMTNLWNERWEKMSFGPMQFESSASQGAIFLRFLLFYLTPIFVFIAGAVLVGLMAATGGLGATAGAQPDFLTFALVIAGVYIVFFGLLGVVALIYYSAFYREAIGHLSLGQLEFAFTARTKDWIKLMLGNIALVVCTLGIGYIFVGYRNWSFFARHMEAYGEVTLDDLTQSTTRKPGQGEGLLDAFDIGAF